MGIEGVYLDKYDIANLMNLDLAGGFLIERIIKGSPADKAGLIGGSIPSRMLGRDFLLGGDLILKFNAKEACDSECLADMDNTIGVEDTISVEVLRAGKTFKTTIDLTSTRKDFLEGIEE